MQVYGSLHLFRCSIPDRWGANSWAKKIKNYNKIATLRGRKYIYVGAPRPLTRIYPLIGFNTKSTNVLYHQFHSQGPGGCQGRMQSLELKVINSVPLYNRQFIAVHFRAMENYFLFIEPSSLKWEFCWSPWGFKAVHASCSERPFVRLCGSPMP